MICHAQGDPHADPQSGGCCWIAGNICPMRWFVDASGDVYDSDRVLVDTLDQAIRNTFGVNNPMVDRPQFDVRWGEEYAVGGSAEAVGDAWEGISRPRDWCVVYGPSEGQCCHREDQATNDARRANVTVTGVSIRSQATGAS